MGMWDWFKRSEPIEQRASASGFTAEVMAMREQWISGSRGIGELTAVVQSCVSLWEAGLSSADVEGTDLLTRRIMALAARSLALRGEAVFLVKDRKLIPTSDWELTTEDGEPAAYRLSVSEAGGGTTQTALSGEVIHVRIGADVSAPYYGQAPLKRANLTANLLHAVESALAEVYENMPLGSLVVPMPESTETDLAIEGRDFRGRRGRVLLRESVAVTAAGGPQPASDWRPADLTPDISKAMPRETWTLARDSISQVFGVLPCLHDAEAMQGPSIREAERHLGIWTLQPIANLIAEEATAKLGSEVKIDCLRPLQAFDAGGRARAVATLIEGLARAKEAGLAPGDVAGALRLVDWSKE